MKDNDSEVKMLLAGDVGGTKTLLGLFERGPARPRPVAIRAYPTLEFPDLAAMIERFVRDVQDPTTPGPAALEAACLVVAGPFLEGTADLTNVPWRVNASEIAGRFRIGRVDLLNDLQAMAYGLLVLDRSEVHVLQECRAVRGGTIALIAAGTGLGISMLHYVDGRYVPMASEGGHADFAARTEREVHLMRWLTERYGRAEVEGVISGRGLINIHQAAHGAPCPAVPDLRQPEAPAEITAAALANQCPACVETLDLFVEAYGAEAGNLALRTVATGGVFVGGGIAPKILPALADGRFVRAFRSKAPFEALLAAVPVQVVLNPDTALLGAAVFASRRDP